IAVPGSGRGEAAPWHCLRHFLPDTLQDQRRTSVIEQTSERRRKRRFPLVCSAMILAAWLAPARGADDRPQGNARLSPATFRHFQQVIRTDYESAARPW